MSLMHDVPRDPKTWPGYEEFKDHLNKASFHNAAEGIGEMGAARKAERKAAAVVIENGWRFWMVGRAMREIEPLCSVDDIMGRVMEELHRARDARGKADRLNVNDKVRIKLTDLGREKHRERHDRLRQGHPIKIEYLAPTEDSEGWSEWQLWEVMQLFGSSMTLGFDLPFATEIQLVPSD